MMNSCTRSLMHFCGQYPGMQLTQVYCWIIMAIRTTMIFVGLFQIWFTFNFHWNTFVTKRFKSQQEIDAFLGQPRLAMLIYRGSRPAPTGVPVWFDWNGKAVHMFSGRTSPKVKQLHENANVSVVVNNRVGESEGWVALNGKIVARGFSPKTGLPC
jgi:hypothetical protein